MNNVERCLKVAPILQGFLELKGLNTDNNKYVRDICGTLFKYFQLLEKDYNILLFDDNFLISPNFLHSINKFILSFATTYNTVSSVLTIIYRCITFFTWLMEEKKDNEMRQNINSVIDTLNTQKPSRGRQDTKEWYPSPFVESSGKNKVNDSSHNNGATKRKIGASKEMDETTPIRRNNNNTNKNKKKKINKKKSSEEDDDYIDDLSLENIPSKLYKEEEEQEDLSLLDYLAFDDDITHIDEVDQLQELVGIQTKIIENQDSLAESQKQKIEALERKLEEMIKLYNNTASNSSTTPSPTINTNLNVTNNHNVPNNNTTIINTIMPTPNPQIINNQPKVQIQNTNPLTMGNNKQINFGNSVNILNSYRDYQPYPYSSLPSQSYPQPTKESMIYSQSTLLPN